MTHEHYGRATVEVAPCSAEITLEVRIDPSGPSRTQRVDLGDGKYFVLDGDRSGVTIVQRRDQPLYR